MLKSLWRVQRPGLKLWTRRITTEREKDSLCIHWKPNEQSRFSYLWLRDNCPCPECIHPSNRQKLHSSADVPLDIQPTSVTLDSHTAKIVWNKPLRHQKDQALHTSSFPLEFLQRYQNQKTADRFRWNHLSPVSWDKQSYAPQWVAYEHYMQTDQGLYQVVQQLFQQGLVFLKGVPTRDSAVTEVAERIGPVQETFYGRDFDVKNVARSTNIAYTSLYLGFHMDLMYLDSPPGVQLLHSLQNTVTGGASIFLDSFRAVELLRQEHWQDYELLRTTPVTFHYLNNGHHMYFRRPTIVSEPLHGSAWSHHVNYAPQFQAPLDLEPRQMPAFYRAFQRLADLVQDPDLRVQLTLRPGDLVLFANRRVLHGRTQFDPTSGHRHLKGTYLTLDSLKDKFRVLSAQFNP